MGVHTMQRDTDRLGGLVGRGALTAVAALALVGGGAGVAFADEAPADAGHDATASQAQQHDAGSDDQGSDQGSDQGLGPAGFAPEGFGLEGRRGPEGRRPGAPGPAGSRRAAPRRAGRPRRPPGRASPSCPASWAESHATSSAGGASTGPAR